MEQLRISLVDMEKRIFHNIFNIKLMIEQAQPLSFMHSDNFLYPTDYVSKSKKNDDINYSTTYKPVDLETSSKTIFFNSQLEDETSRLTMNFPARSLTTVETTTKKPENSIIHKLKSLDRSKNREKVTTTTQMPFSASEKNEYKNQYKYYWKLDNFPQVFRFAKKHELFSHVFIVKGLSLRIQGKLHFLENENLFLGIEHLADIVESDMGVEINDGIVFKEIAEEKIFQYSFIIMDQTRPNRDLISPVFWNTDTDKFLIPNCIDVLSNYLKDDSLMIQLIIMF
jgi:hypothetical protein